MAKVSVLYIRDEIVAPHLELLRNMCEPSSKAKPHVTVRFFRKLAIPADHLKTVVSYIDLLAPGAFLDKNLDRANRTVFIRCQAEELLHLEHKPLFPTSEFHITVYDGTSEPFAKRLLKILGKYKWAFRVELPPLTSLTTIDIKPRNAKKKILIKSREYSLSVRSLFEKIFGHPLKEEFVLSLSDKERLNFAELICDHLHKSVSGYQIIKIPKAKSVVGLDRFPEKEYDIHLTPPELAQEIAAYALTFNTNPKIDFGDPAVGTGAFYSALLKVSDKENISSAIGIDISSKQVEAAKWRWKNKDIEILKGDYLHMDQLPLRNLILANPPYMRHQGIPSAYKLELRQRASLDFGIRISGLSGQYLYFVLLSHKWMAQGAMAAWLIPSEFMQTGYGKALRYYFSKVVQLLRIHQFDSADPQFENAEVLPCVVVFKNIAPDVEQEIIFSSGGSLLAPVTTERVTLSQLNPELKWSIRSKPIVERNDSFVKLGALFSVKRGIATGANNFFVMDRSHAEELGIPEIALKPLLPKAMSLGTDVIRRKRDGYPNLQRQMCVIDCDLTEEQISKKYPKFMDYLNKGKSEGVLNGHLVSRRSPWYKQEQRDPPLFLCTYMGKAHGDKPAIRFIWNKSNAIATNTYLLLYPHPQVKKLLKQNPSMQDELFNALKDSSWNSIEEFTRSHAGGLSKIEPRELEEVWLGPLPNELLYVASKKLI